MALWSHVLLTLATLALPRVALALPRDRTLHLTRHRHVHEVGATSKDLPHQRDQLLRQLAREVFDYERRPPVQAHTRRIQSHITETSLISQLAA